MKFDKYLNNTFTRELFNTFIGKKLGSGCFRDVYSCLTNPDLVIKIENKGGSFCNVHEWETWMHVGHTDEHAKWFAPCIDISPCGMFLIQKKVKIASDKEGLPDKIPAYFTDTSFDNWGFYEGRVVCADYGNSLLIENGLTKRMKKAKWW